MAKGQLRIGPALAYVAPIVPVWMLHAPALSVLPALYAKHAGISLSALGAILLITRLFDGITDPLAGYLSDRTRSRLGPRKPWIVAGGIIATISCYFWFRPAADTGPLYFLLWSIGVYIGWTLMEIPHSAWLAELTQDYDERSRLSSYRTAAVYVGYVLFFCAPLLPFFATTEITPEVTSFVSWAVIALLIVSVPIMAWKVPSGELVMTDRPRLKEILLGMWRNRPFHIFFGCMLAGNVASGMVGALYFFFMDAYLGIADKIVFVALGTSALGVVSSQFWPPVMALIGKHGALAASATGAILTLAIMAFIPPGPLAFPLMLVIFACSSVTATGQMVSNMAIMADVVDYDELRTGKNNAASYYSFNAFIAKFGVAIGGGLSLVIAGLFGFDPNGHNAGWPMAGFFTAFIGVPILLNLSSLWLALRFPLNRRRHAIIAHRLARRKGK